MLYLMRKKAGNWLIKILLGAIVVVFMFWGVGSYSEKRRLRVAIVNGKAISTMEYNQAYNQIMERLKQQFGANLNDDLLEMMNVKQQALNQIIDRQVLLDEAERLNFNVAPRELADMIRNIPAFQENGVFSQRLYTRLLAANRLTPEGFEQQQKEALLINKLRSFITGFVKISDREAREYWQWEKAAVKIKYVVFKPETYTDIQPTDEEIKAYFEKHKEEYKTQPQRKARYVEFNPDDYRDQVEIKDYELEEYHQSHPEEFEQPKTVEARHILIKVAADADAEAVAQAQAKADEVYKKAKEGADFAELAKKESEGPTKDKGGYLGTFKKDAMVKPFADKAFAMQPGEISEPVRTRFGWHVIKVEKVNEASVRTFEEAKIEIRGKLTTSRAKIRAYDAADALFEASYDGEDLAATAKASGLEAQTTELFAQNKPPKEIKKGAQFAAAAFKLRPMDVSDIQDLGDVYYIMQVTETVPGKIPPLADVEAKVKTRLTTEMRDQTAAESANAFLEKVRAEGVDFEAESQKLGLEVKATDFFKRNDSPQGVDRALVSAAFQLSESKKLPEDVVKGRQGYYIPMFTARQAPDMTAFEKEADAIKERLRSQKEAKIFSGYLAEVKARSEISIEPEYAE